jgi:hypothetical protein
MCNALGIGAINIDDVSGYSVAAPWCAGSKPDRAKGCFRQEALMAAQIDCDSAWYVVIVLIEDFPPVTVFIRHGAPLSSNIPQDSKPSPWVRE